jgi:hypothetical protein
VDRLSKLCYLPSLNYTAHLGLLFGLEGYGILLGLIGVACLAVVVIVVFAPKLWDIAIESIADLFESPCAPVLALEIWQLALDRRFFLQDSSFALQSSMWRSRSTRRRANVTSACAGSVSIRPSSSTSAPRSSIKTRARTTARFERWLSGTWEKHFMRWFSRSGTAQSV